MVYAYRWNDNTVSFVSAASRDDAVFKLDEVAAADPKRLIPLKDFQVCIRLGDLAEYKIESWGEETLTAVMEKIYPELGEVYEAAPDPRCEPSEKDLVDTVERIRTKTWD